MNFHITDLSNLFHHIKMYFVFIMQSNFDDSLNAGIFYAYFLFAYLFELIDKDELYACVGLRLERFLKHLLLWICDLLQNTRF